MRFESLIPVFSNLPTILVLFFDGYLKRIDGKLRRGVYGIAIMILFAGGIGSCIISEHNYSTSRSLGEIGIYPSTRPKFVVIDDSWFFLDRDEFVLVTDKDDPVLSIKVLSNSLIVSAVVRDSTGSLIGTLRNNVWKKYENFSSDRNYRDNLIEILDNSGDVAFQLAIVDNVLVVNAVLFSQNGNRLVLGKTDESGKLFQWCNYPSEYYLHQCPKLSALEKSIYLNRNSPESVYIFDPIDIGVESDNLKKKNRGWLSARLGTENSMNRIVDVKVIQAESDSSIGWLDLFVTKNGESQKITQPIHYVVEISNRTDSDMNSPVVYIHEPNDGLYVPVQNIFPVIPKGATVSFYAASGGVEMEAMIGDIKNKHKNVKLDSCFLSRGSRFQTIVSYENEAGRVILRVESFDTINGRMEYGLPKIYHLNKAPDAE